MNRNFTDTSPTYIKGYAFEYLHSINFYLISYWAWKKGFQKDLGHTENKTNNSMVKRKQLNSVLLEPLRQIFLVFISLHLCILMLLCFFYFSSNNILCWISLQLIRYYCKRIPWKSTKEFKNRTTARLNILLEHK